MSRTNCFIITMAHMLSVMKLTESNGLLSNLKTPMSLELTSALSTKGPYSFTKLLLPVMATSLENYNGKTF